MNHAMRCFHLARRFGDPDSLGFHPAFTAACLERGLSPEDVRREAVRVRKLSTAQKLAIGIHPEARRSRTPVPDIPVRVRQAIMDAWKKSSLSRDDFIGSDELKDVALCLCADPHLASKWFGRVCKRKQKRDGKQTYIAATEGYGIECLKIGETEDYRVRLAGLVRDYGVRNYLLVLPFSCQEKLLNIGLRVDGPKASGREYRQWSEQEWTRVLQNNRMMAVAGEYA